MGLFTKLTDVEKLQKKSANIINVFTRTANSLKEVNEQITDSVTEKLEIMLQLEREVADLAYTKDTNAKIIINIEKILQ